MTDKIKKNTNIEMKKNVNFFKNTINNIRTNNASKNLLSKLLIKSYGTENPLYKLANIMIKNQQTAIITIYDIELKNEIEKTIINSKLNLNCNSNKNEIQVNFPELTEENRKKIITIIKNNTEECKISIRNIRKNSNNKIKTLLKEKKINKDEVFKLQNEIQKLTDYYIKEIDKIFQTKKQELKTI